MPPRQALGRVFRKADIQLKELVPLILVQSRSDLRSGTLPSASGMEYVIHYLYNVLYYIITGSTSFNVFLFVNILFLLKTINKISTIVQSML